MELYTAQLQLNKNLEKGFNGSIDNDVKTNISTPQSHIAEIGETKVTLSSKALTMQDIDKTEIDKTYE
ncbi:MAG: hypothetical protein V5789_12470 [Colwellia sp.]